MPDPTQPRSSGESRARLIGAAGIVIILLSAGAALLPIAGPEAGSKIIGALLIAAGVAEMLAGTQRHETRVLAMLAGAATTLAGLLFLLNLAAKFSPTVIIVTAWLLVRSVILLITSGRAHGNVRLWLGLSAATDLALGLLLVAGLSITSLVVSLFGATPALVASFAWVFALSFVVTGVLLLVVASCERESDGEAG